jgi:hypothetical protein
MTGDVSGDLSGFQKTDISPSPRVVELEALDVPLAKRSFCKGTELKAGCEDVGYPWYHEI